MPPLVQPSTVQALPKRTLHPERTLRSPSGLSRSREFFKRYASKSPEPTRISYDNLDTVSEASYSSADLDDDRGTAPAPPEFVRRAPEASNAAGARNNSISHYRASSSNLTTPESHDLRSVADSADTYETRASSIHTLPALQTKGLGAGDHLEPLLEDDPASYDLVEPGDDPPSGSYSIEVRGEQIFSKEHLQAIFHDPKQLLKFTHYLGAQRPQSVPLLIYYLDALKALKAIQYSNAVAEALDPLEGVEFSKETSPATRNEALQEKASQAFDLLVKEDLPAYVSSIYTAVVSISIQKRITGRLPPHLREASEGLAEVFCVSDPSRPDNPIVFASEEFHRTTQYGMSYAIGRNCRFLQGPRTNPSSITRLREAVKAGRDHCECFINYRRDGSPFMNLLMIAPLRDSRGVMRYFIGAQVDVSGLAKECTDLEALQRMLEDKEEGNEEEERKDELQELSEMFNLAELDIVRRYGGRMHREHVEENDDSNSSWQRPRLLLINPSPEGQDRDHDKRQDQPSRVHGKLAGVYQHYLLVRPYPSLRILFASPSLRVPGILQSPFMDRIGSSERVREELVAALAEGRGVTAKIRWVSKSDEEGRNRWIHCTPLLGQNGVIGVWMIVLVDDQTSHPNRKFRQAPPVAANIAASFDNSSRPPRSKTSMSMNSRSSTAMSNRGPTPAPRSSSRSDFDFRI